MKILAIDHGKTSGYAVMEDGKVFVSSYTLEETDKNLMFVEFYRKVERLILDFRPDIIACEYPSDMLNAETARQLIGYYTIIKVLAGLYNINIQECFVSSVRKCVTGTGKAEKITVCDALVNKLKVPREMIEDKVYYKSKLNKYDGKIKGYLYDKSDALALAFYTLYKDEPYIKGHGMYPKKEN